MRVGMNGPSTISARCVQTAVVPIGIEHIVDEIGAVAAAAGRDQDVVALGLPRGHVRSAAGCARRKADIAHARLRPTGGTSRPVSGS